MVPALRGRKAVLFTACTATSAWGLREADGALGCTASVFNGNSTKNNAAFAGMNADCSNCDGRLAYVPAGDHGLGAKRKVYMFSGAAPRWIGYGRGSFYEPKEGETPTPAVGEVSQIAHTFGYWEGVLPLINEKGLSMGESSCAARLMNWPVGGKKGPTTGVPALIDLSSMMQIAMERCVTSLCAVQTMGSLAEEHGFYPMPNEWTVGKELDGRTTVDDGGEAVTVADATGDAWVFHVVGGYPGIAKSVWVAQRVPKGHAAFIANNFIIKEVPEEQTADFLFSPNIRAVAKAAGFWDEGKALHFTNTFAPDTVTFTTHGQPIPLYASLRLWRLFTLAAPSKNWEVHLQPMDYPWSVEVEKPLDRRDIFKMHSDLYKGTEFDLGKGALAGPFGNPFPTEGGVASTGMGQIPRGISIQRTVYGVMNEALPEGKAVSWFAIDTPATSVFVPVMAHSTTVDPSYATGTNRKFTRNSAWWAFDFVNNWSKLNYNMMSENDIYPKQDELQTMLDQELAELHDTSSSHVNAWQSALQKKVVDQWWQLSDYLIVKYNDGFLNEPHGKVGVSYGYPQEWAKSVGFNGDVHPIEVERKQIATHTLLPSIFEEGEWLYEEKESKAPIQHSTSTVAAQSQLKNVLLAEHPASVTPDASMLSFTLLLIGLSFGFVAGRYGASRNVAEDENGYQPLMP
ncbi:unnamed protein product [Amoebophrya sp. A25]|nr:unnamed protein product [Amoebophrya sp. A25]|eukprot:GSA25T00015787001.1